MQSRDISCTTPQRYIYYNSTVVFALLYPELGTDQSPKGCQYIKNLTCPSSGALALVLIKGQQAADALVGAGVVGVTRGVLRCLAVLSGEAKRADTGGAAGNRHTR